MNGRGKHFRKKARPYTIRLTNTEQNDQIVLLKSSVQRYFCDNLELLIMAPKDSTNISNSPQESPALSLNVIADTPPTALEESAARSELAAMHRGEEVGPSNEESVILPQSSNPGTLLEAAFVDPAYAWPPEDGQGRNAIELQASLQLAGDCDDASEFTTESMAARMAMPENPASKRSRGFLWCCGKKSNNSAVVSSEQMRQYAEQKALAKENLKQHVIAKKEWAKEREKKARRSERYNRVPEGILIYRLDTAQRTLELLSPPHDKTDMDRLVTSCVVRSAEPHPLSRRTIEISTEDGDSFLLTACEQRTATAWLEAFGLMHAKHHGKRGLFGGSTNKVS